MNKSQEHRVEQALQRAQEPLPLPSLQLNDVAIYVGLMRQAAYLATLKLTEEADREAIRAHYELRRQEIASKLRAIELAIRQDREVFELLLRDATAITQMLIERGEVEAAMEVQKRLFSAAPTNTLDKLATALSSNKYVRIR